MQIILNLAQVQNLRTHLNHFELMNLIKQWLKDMGACFMIRRLWVQTSPGQCSLCVLFQLPIYLNLEQWGTVTLFMYKTGMHFHIFDGRDNCASVKF